VGHLIGSKGGCPDRGGIKKKSYGTSLVGYRMRGLSLMERSCLCARGGNCKRKPSITAGFDLMLQKKRTGGARQ